MTLKNIKENAIINLKAVQISNGSADNIDFTTTGTFYMRGDKFYIFYNENEEMGMADCRVMIIASGESISMKRSGDFELKLNYRKGESESVVYYTPFGEINLTQTTNQVKCNLSDCGGEICLKYSLAAGANEQQNELYIKVDRKTQM